MPAAALAAVSLLGGCVGLLPSPAPPQSPHQEAQPYRPAPSSSTPLLRKPPPQRLNRLSPATRSLVIQARAQQQHGDLDGASTTLDRALRIEPNNPLVWIELGRLRLAEKDAHQAEGCARKALTLASGDRGAQAQAGRVLVDALHAQRRNQEASEVERQPFMR